jgi:hypothetical protein
MLPPPPQNPGFESGPQKRILKRERVSQSVRARGEATSAWAELKREAELLGAGSDEITKSTPRRSLQTSEKRLQDDSEKSRSASAARTLYYVNWADCTSQRSLMDSIRSPG